MTRLRDTVRRLRSHERGFTMMELVVVMPMLTVLLGAIVFGMTTLMKWNDQAREQTTQQSTVRATLTQMVKELRSAMPASSGTAPIVANATATSISFFVPDRTTVTSGINVPFRLTEVAYTFSNGSLYRQAVTSTNTYTQVSATPPVAWTSALGTFPLASWPVSTSWNPVLGPATAAGGAPIPPLMSGSGFTYYDSSGAAIAPPISNPLGVRSVGVTIVASSSARQGKTTTYNDIATIRETQLG